MPRNVRNFWIECDIDGRKERLAGGPVSKDGGFHLVVWQRDDGQPWKALRIIGFAGVDGSLRLEIEPRELSTEGSAFSIESTR
jgi:hypothetical protein